MGKRLATLFLLTTIGLVFGTGPSDAHKGYHYAGVKSGSGIQSFGVQATIQVGNSYVSSENGGKDHFIAAVHMARFGMPAGSSCEGTVAKIEIGWMEAAWRLDGAGNPARSIFVQHSNDCKFKFWNRYPVQTGDNIIVRLAPRSDCSAGVPCYWRAMLYWEGAWRTLQTVQMPFDNQARPDAVAEVQTVKQTTMNHWNIANPTTNGRINFRDVRVRRSTGGWANWTDAELDGCREATLPYLEEYFNYGTSTWSRTEGYWFYRFRALRDTGQSQAVAGC